jgi:hypothetical protein
MPHQRKDGGGSHVGPRGYEAEQREKQRRETEQAKKKQTKKPKPKKEQ